MAILRTREGGTPMVETSNWYAYQTGNDLWHLEEVNDLTAEDVDELIDLLQTIRVTY